MSTRSVVEIKTTLGRIALYRHMDGYPAVGGATLVEGIRALYPRNKWDAYQENRAAGERLVSWLLALRYPETAVSKNRPIYEITTRAEDHGDLEWVYRLDDVVGPACWRVGIAARNENDWRLLGQGPNSRGWLLFPGWRAATRDLLWLVDVVNRHRRECNQRIEEMRREARALPGAPPGASGRPAHYEMLPTPGDGCWPDIDAQAEMAQKSDD